MNYPLVRPVYYYSLFKEILNFIKSPKNVLNTEKSVRVKVYDTIGLYFIKLVFLIPVVLFFALVYDPENVQSVRMMDRFTPPMLLLVGGIILPLVEEIGFRLSLKFKPVYLAASLSVFVYYFLTKAVFQTNISLVDESFATRVLISLSSGVVLLPIFNTSSVKEKLASFWNRHFRSIFYLSCIIFAWIHISKYEITFLNVLLLPILTIPQLLSAIIYGYTRVSFGFKYPLFLHMSVNLIAISLSLLPFTD